MNKQMLEVMQRREELLARIALQRGQIAHIASSCKTPLAFADRGWAAVRLLRSMPMLVTGVMALLVARKQGLMGLLRGGWLLWEGYSFFTAFSAKLSSRKSDTSKITQEPRA